jgi:hypothetical protein
MKSLITEPNFEIKSKKHDEINNYTVEDNENMMTIRSAYIRKNPLAFKMDKYHPDNKNDYSDYNYDYNRKNIKIPRVNLNLVKKIDSIE